MTSLLVYKHNLSRRDAWVGALAIGLVGGVFATVKTLPAAHAACCALLAAVLGHKPLLIRDPSDLLALPVLAASWRLWRAVGDAPVRRTWPVLALASLATLANMAAPDHGVIRLAAHEGQILAVAYYGRDTFASRDGGLTWAPYTGDLPEVYGLPERGRTWEYTVEGTHEVYRFTPAERIERSTDGGRTWATELRLRGADARSAYYQAVHYTAGGRLPGPLHAHYDPASGHLVVAMGREGALVRTAGGDWRWVAVGPYHFEPLQRTDQFALLLQGELWLALAVLLLGVSALGFARQALWQRVLLLLLGLAWAVLVLAGQPALRSGYDSFLTLFPTLGLLVALLPLAVYEGVRHLRASRALLGRALAVALGAGLLFLLPYMLWGVGLIPRYAGAAWLAVPLVVLALAAGYRWLPDRRERG